MGAVNEIGELAKNLVPPHDADPEKIWRWRVFLAGTVIFMALGISAHIALACGYIPILFSGFANAADVQNIAQQQTLMRMESVGDSIYNMRRDQCIARNSGNLLAAQVQDQRIREKMDLYRSLTVDRRQYDLPDCTLFVTN